MTVWDAQGNVYDAVQVTTAGTSVNGRIVPVGWWIVTNAYGKRSDVSPQSFLTMFTPAQGTLQLGQPGGAASLNKSGLVEQHSAFEALPYGTATLDQNGDLVQIGNLATINASGQVVQNPASYGQPNGAATLDASGDLVQTAGLVLASSLGVAGGVATLDANGHVQQQATHGTYRKWSYYNTAGGNVTNTAWSDFPFAWSATPQLESDGTGLFLVRLSAFSLQSGASPYIISFQLVVDGGSEVYSLGGASITLNNYPTSLCTCVPIGALSSGIHQMSLQTKQTSSVNTGIVVRAIVLEVEQYES